MCFIRYPNTSKSFKKNSAAPCFFNLLLIVWISDETYPLVFDILLQDKMSLAVSCTYTTFDAKAKTEFLCLNMEERHYNLKSQSNKSENVTVKPL